MAVVVTEEEFLHWRDSRVTRAFMYALKQDREWLKEKAYEIKRNTWIDMDR